MAQRITRAKRKIGDGGDSLRGAARRGAARAPVESVLATLYLIFNAGYGPPVRSALCAEAIRLGAPARRADARRGRGDRPARADAAPRLAARGPGGRRRPPRAARRPGPVAAGTAEAITAGERLVARGLAAGGAGRVPDPGVDRGRARARLGLDADRLALRPALARVADAGGGAQPRGRDRGARRA